MFFLILLILLGVLLYDYSRKKPSTTNQENPLEVQVREKIVQQIEFAASNEKDPHIKQGMMRAASVAKSGAVAVAANIDTAVKINDPNFLAPISNPEIGSSNPLSATNVDTQPAITLKAPQSNAITLLYVGAFLFVTAMIIFIAAPVLSGGIKTFLVLLTAMLFYGTGLWLYQSSKLFKSAGQSFVAIGMVILPLAGIAAYNLVFDKQHAYGVWFITSLVSCSAYVYALIKLRTPLMGYLSVLSALSLAESAVLTTGLPLYFISWTLAILAVGLAILGRYKNLWPEQKEPLQFSAHLLLPTSLAIASFNIQNFGWWQFSAALLLSAGFYLYCAQDAKQKIDNRASFYALSMIMFLGIVPSVATAMGASMQASLLALLTATTVLATNVSLFTRLGENHLFRQSLEIIAVIPFIIIWFMLAPEVIVIAMALSIIILGSVAWSLKSAVWLGASFIPLLAMPLAISSTRTPGLSPIVLSIIYLWLGMLTLGVRYLTMNKNKEVNTSISSLYVVALAIGWFFAVSHSLSFGAGMLALDMVLLAVASFIEKEPKVFAVAYAGLFPATALALYNTGSSYGLYLSISFAILGLSAYAIAEMFQSSDRATLIQLVAPVGVYAASLSTFFTDSAASFLPGLLLAAGALLVWLESKKQKVIEMEAIAYITLAAAASWLIFNANVRELLVYTHLWAATFGMMYYWRKQNKDDVNANNYLILALLAFSVPFSIQALGDSGGTRGWLFVIEHILLMLVGMAAKNDTVIKWGLIATIGAVIFQLRDLTFLLLGILGLTVIGIAIWLLNREGKKLGPKP